MVRALWPRADIWTQFYVGWFLVLFVADMLANSLGRAFMLRNAACETNKTCVTQVTFKFVNKALLLHHWWLKFSQFKISFNLVSYKNRLNGDVNFLAQVFKLIP